MKTSQLKKHICWVMGVYLLFMSLFPTNLLAAPSSDTLNIAAEGVVLMDAKTGEVLYEKNPHQRYYPASITKLMTALLAIENLKSTDIISFSEEAIHGVEPGSSSIGIRIGEQLTVDQALHGLLLMSANEISNGIAEKVSGSVDNFAITMTKRAHELGATNTQFANPHGLHDENHYTTAYDMALIMRELYDNEYFREIMSHPTYQIPETNKSNEIRYLSQEHKLMNELRDSRLYRPDVIGGKTGFTNEARHTLVTAASKNGIDLIVVILKGDSATMYKDTTTLLDYGFNSYQSLTLHTPNDIITTLPVYAVQSGKLFETAVCQVSVPSAQSILVPQDVKFREINTDLELPPYLELGATEGQVVGSIKYINNQQLLASNDLVVSHMEYTPSPFSATYPDQSNLSFPIGFFIVIGLIIVAIIVVIILIKNKYRRKRFKHKKLKFSKTIK